MKKLLAAVTVLAVSTAQADTIHVDANCPGPGNGSEADPYCAIQTAIDNAVDTDEIVVAQGIYGEVINFVGKAITLRSSSGPDVTIIDPNGIPNSDCCVPHAMPGCDNAQCQAGVCAFDPSCCDEDWDEICVQLAEGCQVCLPVFSGSVVTCTDGEGPDSVLDGFTVSGGIAGFGGGMRNEGSNPTVINCVFKDNTANTAGGMYNNSAGPTVINCTFSRNSSSQSTGGGMFNSSASPKLVDCTFNENTGSWGGGMYNSNSDVRIIACTFDGNIAEAGGGLALSTSNIITKNV